VISPIRSATYEMLDPIGPHSPIIISSVCVSLIRLLRLLVSTNSSIFSTCLCNGSVIWLRSRGCEYNRFEAVSVIKVPGAWHFPHLSDKRRK
jgi:hypothetical protein